MKKKLTLLLLSLFAGHKISAQSYLPVATTGYSFDAIAENITALATTSGALDGVNVMYSAAHAALVSSPYGLPNNGTLSSSTRTFQLQNYTGSNLLFIQPSGQDSLTFTTPAAYQNLSLLDFATDAWNPTTMSVTIRFTDNSTQVFSSVTVYDWLYTGQPSFASGFDRMNRSSGAPANEGGLGNPRFFTTDLPILCSNQSKFVKRIIIKNTGTAIEKLGILAVSGEATPLTASASPNNLCTTGGSATITAGGASTFTWLPVGNFTGSNAATISVTPTVTTQYTVQAVSALNCTFNAMVTVNVHTAVPSLTISNTANSGGICPTQTITLTASGATTYTWTGGSVAITNGLPFAPTTSGDYTVTGGNACGTTTAMTSVSIHPLPNITPVASSSSLCSGGSVTLTGTGNSTNYVWSGFTSPISDGVGFSPLVTATYSVIGTSALSCTAMATIPVTVVTTPLLAPTAQPVYICLGGSSTLTASGATNYTWTSATQTVYTNTMVTTPSNTGSETFTVTKANANCVDTKMITVVTHSLPVVFAIATPTLVCALNSSTLAVAGGQTYTWTAPNGITFSGASPVVTPSASSVYTVAAHDGTCVNTTTVLVATNPNPTISIVPTSSTICKGQSVTMTANGSNSFTWTSASGTVFTNPVTETPTTSIAYTAKGVNNFGCTSSAVQIIVVNPIPTVAITVIKPLVCSGGLSTLTASGANTYTWDANAGGAQTASSVVTSTALASGPVIYTVSGTYTATGCQSSKTVQVNVFVPVLTITGNTNTCEGGNVTLAGSGGNNGSYSWNTGVGNPSPGSTITRSLVAPAVFTLTAMTNSGSIVCPATKTVGLGIYSNPTITAVAQRTTICRFEKVELYGEGGVSYSWSTGGTQPTITVGPVNQVQTLSYTVTGTDANGCVSTGTVQVKVSGCTGISEANMQTNNGLQVYPNPNNGQFVIETSADMNLVLSNELGQIVRTLVLSGANSHTIQVSDLAQGIYFITGQGINQKIIVTK